MKKYLFTGIFIFLVSAVGAQITFEKAYGDTSSNTGRYFLQAADSGFYVMCTYYDIYTHQSNLQIIKTNKYGDSLSSSIPQFPLGNGEVCPGSKNNFIVVAVFDSLISQNQYIDTLYITRVDTAGNVMSVWKYADTLDFQNVNVYETSDGGYLVGAGVWNYPYLSNILLMKLDTSGSIEWKEIILPYSTGAGEYVKDMIETDDHHYIIEVQQSSGSMWTGNKLMMKADTLGNILWSTNLTYGYAGGSVHQMIATDSGYIYLDNIAYSISSPVASRISLVDTGGTLRWSKLFSQGSFYSQIIQDPQKEFYLVDRVPVQITQWDILITKLDQQLDSVSSAYFGFTSTEEIDTYFAQLADMRLACLGYSKWGTTVQNNDVYFLVCDSMLSTNQSEITGTLSEILLYPNPTEGKFTISFGQNATNEIGIFNIFGMQIGSWQFSTAKNEAQIDLTGLPPGIYFLQATSGEKVWRGRVVKE